MARKKISSLPPPTPIAIEIGNCEVTVEAKNHTLLSDDKSLEITLSRNAKIIVSVVEDLCNVKRNGGSQGEGSEETGDYYFVLANPKDSDGQTKSLLKEALNLYTNELPAMNYAANTGKESLFLERCVSNGKYCTLLLKSRDAKQAGEVIAAISFQIIPAHIQYAEVPLAAVSSVYQHQGFGCLLYMELRKRLQSIGICSIFCWGDKESEGFWLKQGFIVIGKVDRKGRARRLLIKADIRRALCFPGGSTLMVCHLNKDVLPKLEDQPKMLTRKTPAICCPSLSIQEELKSKGKSQVNQLIRTEISQPENWVSEPFAIEGCQEVGLLSAADHCSMAKPSEVKTGSSAEMEICSCFAEGTKKRTWEALQTALKSKKIKAIHDAHLMDCQFGSRCPTLGGAGTIKCSANSRNKVLPASPYYLLDSYLSQINSTSDNLHSQGVFSSTKCFRVMLMNIADNNKKSNLTKIIGDLGGAVTSDGSISTHVVSGKVRKTLNFCTALCSGAWILSPSWLKESFRQGIFVDEIPFILEDKDYETKYRTELKCAIGRARGRPQALFKGLDVCLTTHVQPPVSTLSAIIKFAGGRVVEMPEKVNEASNTVFIACEDDMEEARSAVKKGIRTYSSDWLMNCIMRQELDLDAPQFAESL